MADAAIFSLLQRLLIAILPVVAFLFALWLLDSFKLVRIPAVLAAVGWGVGAAVLCYFANALLLEGAGLSTRTYARYVSPLLEEGAKGSYLFLLIRRKKIGFLVDAAILGFAVGAGFGIAENLHYLRAVSGAGLPMLILRGFGTAIMHGGTTSWLGVMSQGFTERRRSDDILAFGPGLLLAYLFHSLFNHFPVSPALSAAGVLVVLPAVMILVFRQSEHSLRGWLGIGFDTDAQLLEMIKTGRILESRIGEYLWALKTRFPPSVVADMLCLLQIQTELSMRAKGVLLMREAGFRVERDPGVEERFRELLYLEKSIGKTGRLALQPCHRWSSRDLWQLHMLAGKR
ncbi:MAG: PrsW family glutamic-type intramembrane protease [Candidatus Eisenbacteria bacterium]